MVVGIVVGGGMVGKGDLRTILGEGAYILTLRGGGRWGAEGVVGVYILTLIGVVV